MIDHPATDRDEEDEGNGNPNEAPTYLDLYLPHTIQQQQGPQRERKRSGYKLNPLPHFRGWWRDTKWTDKTIAIFTMVIAGASLLQWHEMSSAGQQTDKIINAANDMKGSLSNLVTENQKALQQTVADFRASERPVVWLQAPTNEIFRNPEGGFSWNVYYTDYGKTPGSDLCEEIHLEMGKDALKKVVDIAHNSCGGSGKAIGVIAPGEKQFSSGNRDEKVTDAQIGEWFSIEFGVVVWGRFDYSDASGAMYYTQFCLMRQRNSGIAYCPNHNHIH